MLYFGSFNPIHRGHIALSEYVIEEGLCDEVILVVSPHNPLKKSSDLAPELERFAMTEIAASNSQYPDRIKPSVIEFLLERPSYTINTLNHLVENYGSGMEFSILIGADNLATFDKWLSYEQILDRFRLYVYPRKGGAATKFLDRVTMLESAPLFDISSTSVREALLRGERVDEMIPPLVEEHIIKSGLWKPQGELALLTSRVERAEEQASRVAALIERGRYFQRHGEWGRALNDFNSAAEAEPDNCEAREAAVMIKEILEYRYKDIYNP